MACKQRLLTSFSFLKSKRHLFIWIAGFVMLLLVLPCVVFSNHSNNRKIHEILENLETLKSGMSTDSLGVYDIRSRKKRDVGKGKQQEHIPKSFTYSTGGAVYIRWGRTTCPDNNTELVYDGIGGGSLFSHEGDATNPQCLPNKPVWGRYTDGTDGAQMYAPACSLLAAAYVDKNKSEIAMISRETPASSPSVRIYDLALEVIEFSFNTNSK